MLFKQSSKVNLESRIALKCYWNVVWVAGYSALVENKSGIV